MNTKSPSIGIKMKISNNKELMLKKGNNAIYSDSIYLSQLNNLPSHSLLFTLNCINQTKGILRTFKNFPMIIKQMENKGNGPLASQRYMNDSIVYLDDLANIKIIPLTEQKAECILFELCEIDDSCLKENSIQEKAKDNVKTEMDFLDNIIKYYNQEKTKDYDQTIEDKNNEEEFPPEKEEDNYQLSIVYNRNVFKRETIEEIRIEEPREKEREEEEVEALEVRKTNKKKEKAIAVRYHLRKHIHTPIKKIHEQLNDDGQNNKDDNQIENNNFCSSNNGGYYLKKKHNRSLSITIIKCPICLEPIKDNSYLDTCKHEFCKKCIDHWATVSSQCPCCKENFKKIIYYNSRSRNRTEKKIKKKKFKPDEEEIEQWYLNCDEMCFICKRSDNASVLLVCDRCNFRICHTFCVGLDRIPDEDFICPECSNRTKRMKKKKAFYEKKKTMKKYKQNKILNYMENKRSLRLQNSNKKYCLRTNSKRKVNN